LESLRQLNLEGVVFIFVPGHAGVRGNEQAERLAAAAVISDGHAMDNADVCRPFVRWEEWRSHLEMVISNTVERLRNGHVKLGAA
jgi:hypothetical protein